MCLGVPAGSTPCGRSTARGWPRSTSAASARRCASRTSPRSRSGDYTIVHVGFALTKLDEKSALETLELMRGVGLLEQEFAPDAEMSADGTEPGRRVPADGRRAVKYLDEFCDPELAPRLLDEIRRHRHPALGDHGGLRRADPHDHPQRHRPAPARRRRADPRSRLPGLRDPAGDDRPGARHRRPARRHLLLLRRHDPRAGLARATCSASRATAATCASSTRPSTPCASPQENPDKQVVFFGIGFETTAPANAMTVHDGQAARAHQLLAAGLPRAGAAGDHARSWTRRPAACRGSSPPGTCAP